MLLLISNKQKWAVVQMMVVAELYLLSDRRL